MTTDSAEKACMQQSRMGLCCSTAAQAMLQYGAARNMLDMPYECTNATSNTLSGVKADGTITQCVAVAAAAIPSLGCGLHR
jgi:hypothetical protein